MPRPLERIFLGWQKPALAAAAERLVSHYASDRELRLDRATIILPGRRASRRLTEILIDEADRRELRLRPPRIATVGACPELLYTPDPPVAEAVLALRAWTRALRAFDRERLARVFPHPPDAGDPVAWDHLARQLDRLHREIGGAGLSFRDVAERCRDGSVYDDGPRWEALADVQAAYRDALESMGCTDRDFARFAALERGEVASDRELWLVGVVEMPRILRRMLGALEAPVRAVVHAPPELADAFDDYGCVRPDAWRDAEIPLADDDIAIGDRPPDQADEAIRSIAALDARFTADEITIGVPDDAIVPYLEQRLSAHDLPVRYARGTPMRRTAPYRLLEAAADYLADRRFDAFAALLRHPDVLAWWRRHERAPAPSADRGSGDDGRARPDAMDGEREAELGVPDDGRGGPAATSVGDGTVSDVLLAAADEYFDRTLPARVVRPLPGEPHVRAGIGLVVDALEGPSLLGGMTGRRPLTEWAPEILSLLAEIYADRDFDPNDPGDRRLIETCDRIRSAAAGFHALPATVDESVDAATAIRLVLSETARATIPPEPEDAAIELLGWLELHLDDAPALIVTGANEPVLPESINADAFLPNTLRTQLGLTDNAMRYARDAYQLTAILNSRPRVRVIAGRRNAAGDPLRPSRMLFAATDDTVARRVLRFYDDQGAERPAAAPAVPGSAIESGFRLPPESEIRAPEPRASLRVTDFRGLLQDPYRWALERILKLEPLDDHAREMDSGTFGSLAHEVLHRFGETDRVHADDAATVRAELDALLDRIAQRRFGRVALPAVAIQIEQLRARLHAFADWHVAWIRDGWEVVGVECEPDGGVPFDVDGEPIVLRGRIDRVDRNSRTGEWALLDYKTSDSATDPGKSHRKARDGTWVDLQLPLYRHLLPALGLETPTVEPAEPASVRLGYILLPRDLAEVGASVADWTADDLADADETAREVVRAVRRNRFAFDADSVHTWRDDPLAPLLGTGTLAALADAADGADE